jgi:hypothetical protein
MQRRIPPFLKSTCPIFPLRSDICFCRFNSALSDLRPAFVSLRGHISSVCSRGLFSHHQVTTKAGRLYLYARGFSFRPGGLPQGPRRESGLPGIIVSQPRRPGNQARPELIYRYGIFLMASEHSDIMANLFKRAVNSKKINDILPGNS